MIVNNREFVDNKIEDISDLSAKLVTPLKNLQNNIQIPEDIWKRDYGITKNLPMNSISKLSVGQKAAFGKYLRKCYKKSSTIRDLSELGIVGQLNSVIASEAFDRIKKLQLSQINNHTISVLKSLEGLKITLPNKVVIPTLKLEASNVLNNLDFSSLFPKYLNNEKWRGILKRKSRDNLVNCLRFDLYLPLKFFDEIPFSYPLSSQEEADEYLGALLEIIREKDKSIFDFIPDENFDTDKEKLKFLYERKYFKLLLLSCFERVEYIINQLKEKYLGKKSTERSKINETVRDTLKKMQEDNVEDIELTELINSIFQLKKFNEKGFLQFNLFKSFDKNKEILDRLSRNEPPLNRNLAFHGHITDEMATELLANKALLCFGFFATLYNY